MPIYMNYDGIKGDCTEQAHKEWIVVDSCQFGVNRHITNAGGRGSNREAGSPSVSEIVVTKQMDCASANLFRTSVGAGTAASGKTVKIDFCKTEDGKLDVYLNIELENTLISSFSTSGHSGEGSKPMESLSLNFTKITYKTTTNDDKNKSGKPQVGFFNLADQKGG